MVPAGVHRVDARGVGLIELLVVVSLLGLLSLVATPPLYDSWRAAALRAAAGELAGAVAHGRLLAIALNAPVCVAVHADAVRFEAAQGGACSGVALTGLGAQAVRLGGTARVSAPVAGVVFSHLGAATPAGSYTVTDPRTGLTRSVVVAVSGRVSVR